MIKVRVVGVLHIFYKMELPLLVCDNFDLFQYSDLRDLCQPVVSGCQHLLIASGS